MDEIGRRMFFGLFLFFGQMKARCRQFENIILLDTGSGFPSKLMLLKLLQDWTTYVHFKISYDKHGAESIYPIQLRMPAQ